MDISNRTLALLLGLAVVVSLGGTAVSIYRLNSISTTGFATTTGVANLTITSTASLTFTTSFVDFGAGYVNGSGCAAAGCNCTLYSNFSGSAGFRTGCINFVASMPSPFVIENDGNLPLNVTLNSSKNGTEFIGGGSGTNAYPAFQWLVADNETSSCFNGVIGPTSWTNANDSEMAGTGTPICNSLEATQATDTLVIGVRVIIPFDAASGNKTAMLTATGTNP